MTVSDGVSPSPKWGAGADSPPTSATVKQVLQCYHLVVNILCVTYFLESMFVICVCAIYVTIMLML